MEETESEVSASPEQSVAGEGGHANLERRPLLSGSKDSAGGKQDGQREGDIRWSRWRSWVVLCVLWLAQVFMTSAYSLVAPFFPLEAARKGSDSLTTGVIISASPFCLVVATPLCGYFLPKMGTKFTLVSGMFLVGGAFFLMGFLVDMPPGTVFVVFGVLLRMTEGVGWAMVTTTTLSLLAQLFPTRVGTLSVSLKILMGLMELATGLGFTVGPPVGSLLFEIGGFHIPFWTVGGATLVLALVLFLLVKPTGCSSKVLSLWTIAKLLSHLSFSMLVVGNAVVFSSLTFLNPTFAPYLSHQFGLDQLHIGLMFIIVAGVYLLFAFFVGRLSDKFGTKRFIFIGFLTSGISLFFVGPAPFISKPRLWIIIAGLVGQGIGVSQAIIPIYSDLLKQALWLYPNDDKAALTSVVSGLITFSMSLGEFSGALLGGLLTQITDFPTTSLLIGELVLAEAALVLGVSLISRLQVWRCGRIFSIQ